MQCDIKEEDFSASTCSWTSQEEELSKLLDDWNFGYLLEMLQFKAITLDRLKYLTEADLDQLFQSQTIGEKCEFRFRLMEWKRDKDNDGIRIRDTFSLQENQSNYSKPLNSDQTESLVAQDSKESNGKNSNNKMENKAKRSVNWEQEEKELLLNLVLEKFDIIENARIDTNTNKQKKEAWIAVHELFNKVSRNSRTLDQIQNQWRKTKSSAKTKNLANIQQKNQTVVGPALAKPNKLEEQLVCRLSNNSAISDSTPVKENASSIDKFVNRRNEIETKSPEFSERNSNLERENESSKRIKLLDISIKQKELEIKILEENYIAQKRRNELLEKEMKEEHSLKVEKLKLEIEKLKKVDVFHNFL